MRPPDHPTRSRLCNRQNAERIAHRLAETGLRARVIRTGSKLQPFRVDTSQETPPAGENVELEVVIL